MEVRIASTLTVTGLTAGTQSAIKELAKKVGGPDPACASGAGRRVERTSLRARSRLYRRRVFFLQNSSGGRDLDSQEFLFKLLGRPGFGFSLHKLSAITGDDLTEDGGKRRTLNKWYLQNSIIRERSARKWYFKDSLVLKLLPKSRSDDSSEFPANVCSSLTIMSFSCSNVNISGRLKLEMRRSQR